MNNYNSYDVSRSSVANLPGGRGRGGQGHVHPPIGITKNVFKHNFIATESDNIYSSNILHLHQRAPAYKQHTFRIYFDPIRMILTLIYDANAYIVRYRHHPQQAWGPVGMAARTTCVEVQMDW